MGRVRAKHTVVRQLLNPPFSRTFAELGALSDDQLVFLYDVERGGDGFMKVTVPPNPSPSLKSLHARKCFLLGITDPAKVGRLWQEEQARRKPATADRRRRRA